MHGISEPVGRTASEWRFPPKTGYPGAGKDGAAALRCAHRRGSGRMPQRARTGHVDLYEAGAALRSCCADALGPDRARDRASRWPSAARRRRWSRFSARACATLMHAIRSKSAAISTKELRSESRLFFLSWLQPSRGAQSTVDNVKSKGFGQAVEHRRGGFSAPDAKGLGWHRRRTCPRWPRRCGRREQGALHAAHGAQRSRAAGGRGRHPARNTTGH